MSVQQVSVFLENKPGTLLEALTILADANVDLRALCVADTSDFGILRTVVSDAPSALAAFRAHSLPCALTPILGAEMQDKPGALQEILELLYAQNVSVEYTYAFLAPKAGQAYCALKVDAPDRAEAALRAANIRLLEDGELSAL